MAIEMIILVGVVMYFTDKRNINIDTIDNLEKENEDCKKIIKKSQDIIKEYEELCEECTKYEQKYKELKRCIEACHTNMKAVNNDKKIDWIETINTHGETTTDSRIRSSENDFFAYNNSVEWMCGDC